MNEKDYEFNTIESFSDFIIHILTAPDIKPLPEAYADNEQINRLYNYIISVRKIYWAFAQGNFHYDVDIKGVIGGAAKSLQANLRHLSWQVQMVANGDFSQKVDFMGELSSSFNLMISKFEQALNDLIEQKELLKDLTEDLHIEIANRKLAEEALRESEERYRELSRLDPLTNIYNRRYFFELANAEIDRMVRNCSGHCVIAMVDIDHFKVFNDTYGHQMGDTCLKKIAETIKLNLRSFDILGRYGGEEFIILLPQTDTSAGRSVLERIRTTIEETILPNNNNNPISITVSIGYSKIEVTNIFEIQNLLSKGIYEADAALYRAKNCNRNQLCFYE